MKKILTIIICATASAVAQVLMLIEIFYLEVSNSTFFAGMYRRMGLAGQIGISESDLKNVVSNMFGFIKGQSGRLNTVVTINGTKTLFLNAKEKSHVEDVRMLYFRLLLIAAILAAILAAALAYVLISRNQSMLIKTFVVIAPIFMVVMAVVAAFAALRQLDFVIDLHRLLFSNLNWILDLEKDRLILLFPVQLFRNIAAYMAVRVFIQFGILEALGLMINKKQHTG